MWEPQEPIMTWRDHPTCPPEWDREWERRYEDDRDRDPDYEYDDYDEEE